MIEDPRNNLMDTGDVVRFMGGAGRDDAQGEEGPPPEAALPPNVLKLLQQEPVTEAEVALALLRAVRMAAEVGAALQDSRGQKDAAAAALGFAEALAKISTPIVDPRELATIEHQTRLEQAKVQGDLQVEMAEVQTAGNIRIAEMREQGQREQRQQKPKVDPESVSQ